MEIDLTSLGYERIPGSRIWRKPNQADFGYNDGDIHEEYVSGVVSAALDLSSRSTELEDKIHDWPSLYHLSSRRGNVLRPFLSELTGPILEVGAGFGAITRLLGETGNEVYALEGSARRAAACAQRCRDLPNVNVIVDTIQNFGTPARFPTVVAIGVLEYARRFGYPKAEQAGGVDPVDQMLTNLRNLVSPTGELVLAIENKLGLKYFAGYREDHQGIPMFGIEDRYNEDTAVTFGRHELSTLLTEHSFGYQKWYYPFPDYKLPIVVFSEPGLAGDNGFQPEALISWVVDMDAQRPETVTISQPRAWNAVQNNLLSNELANSFIIRAAGVPTQDRVRNEGGSDIPEGGLLAWYYGKGSTRRREFIVEAQFQNSSDGIEVRRERLHPDAPTKVRNLNISVADETYLPGTPWSDELTSITAVKGWSTTDIVKWGEVWFHALLAASGIAITNVSPELMLSGKLLDATPQNMIMHEGTPHFIDQEWSLDGVVPLRYLVFRALLYSLTQIPAPALAADASLDVGTAIASVMAAFGLPVSINDLVHYLEMERELQSTVSRIPSGPTEGVLAQPLVKNSERAATSRSNADFDRVKAEALHNYNELQRVQAEALHNYNELQRVQAEALHNYNELQRVLREFQKYRDAAAG